MRSLEVREQALPSLTTDRARAFADLDAHGYCVIADVLRPAEVTALRARVIGQGQGEDARGVAFHDSKANQRIWMMVNKGRMFRDLVIHPLVMEMMPHLLDEDFILSSLTANIARPGGEVMYLHADQGYLGFWTPKPVVANILWMLDDFTDENGGTRLIPGSHRRARQPEDTQERTIAAVGKAGSALIFDGRLLHGTGANRTTDMQRHGILTYYCRPFIRQQENFFLGMAPELRATEREAFLERIGYRIWAGLGRTDSPGERRLLERLDDPVGALDSTGKVAPDASQALNAQHQAAASRI
jgi:ectoine hydroxylase-related dioxygenase (phytanoyl-CoA dioxygenase family)